MSCFGFGSGLRRSSPISCSSRRRIRCSSVLSSVGRLTTMRLLNRRSLGVWPFRRQLPSSQGKGADEGTESGAGSAVDRVSWVKSGSRGGNHSLRFPYPVMAMTLRHANSNPQGPEGRTSSYGWRTSGCCHGSLGQSATNRNDVAALRFVPFRSPGSDCHRFCIRIWHSCHSLGGQGRDRSGSGGRLTIGRAPNYWA